MRNGFYNLRLVHEDGKVHTWLMSTLVWWYFTGETLSRNHYLKHVDGNLANNAIYNLEKMSRVEIDVNNGYTLKEKTCPHCGAIGKDSPKFDYHMKVCNGDVSNHYKYDRYNKNKKRQHELSSNHL
jgi:rRNA maturation protein Nop10